MKNGIKSIETAGYNGARTVVHFCLALLKMIHTNGKYLVYFFYLNRIFYQKGGLPLRTISLDRRVCSTWSPTSFSLQIQCVKGYVTFHLVSVVYHFSHFIFFFLLTLLQNSYKKGLPCWTEREQESLCHEICQQGGLPETKVRR